MGKNAITLPTKPAGTIEPEQTDIASDDYASLDFLADDLIKGHDKQQVIKSWRNNNTVVYQAGNKNRVNVQVFSHTQMAIALMEASENNVFEHVFTVTISIAHPDIPDVAVRKQYLIGYNGTMVSLLTSGGTVATKQELKVLLELDKRVRKAVALAEVFNENMFRRYTGTVRAMRQHSPTTTEGPLTHK